MTLTIPRAGVIGGAAAQAPQVPADRTGEMLANFGERMMDVGFDILKEREQRGLGQARLATMQGLNDLQQKYQQVGDPDEIDRGYAADAAALRGQILGNLPQNAQEQAGLMFDEMNVSHASAIGRRAVGLRQSAETAIIMATGEEVVRTAGTGDPAAIATATAQLDQQLRTAISRGVMTPEEAERYRQSYGNQTGQARAARMLSDDPDSLTAAIDAGEFGAMSGEQVQNWRARAVTASQSRAAAAQAEADRATRERVTLAQGVLKDGIGVVRAGRDFARSDEAAALLADPVIAATPEAREYRAAVQLQQSMPGFAVLPLPEKRKALDEARKGGIDKAYDNDVVTAMEGAITADEKAFREDPLTRAGEIGLKPPPDLPDPGTAAPDDTVAALRGRAAYAKALADGGYTDRPAFFTAAERETWKARVAPEASPADKAQVALELASGLGPDAELAAAEIGADPVFAYVGGGLAHGMSPELGRQIFEGQRVIDGKHVPLPAPARRGEAFFSEFTDLFSDGTAEGWADQAGVRDQVTAAADALYAYRMRGKVVGQVPGDAETAMLDQAVYLQAAHEVMGGTGRYDRRDAAGGIQDLRGRLTALPPGVRAGDVEDRLDDLAGALSDPERATAAWRSLTLSGNVPDLGGEQMDARTLRSVSLRASGPHSYVMVRPGSDGRLSVVVGDDGNPVEIGMAALLKFGAGAP